MDIGTYFSARAAVIFVGCEVGFAPVVGDAIAISPARVAGLDHAYASQTRGDGIGQRAGASALVGNAASTAGIRGIAGTTIGATTSGIDRAAVGAKLTAGFRSTSTLIGDTRSTALVGRIALSTIQGFAATIRGIAARGSDLRAGFGSTLPGSADIGARSSTDLTACTVTAIQGSVAAVGHHTTTCSKLRASFGSATAFIGFSASSTGLRCSAGPAIDGCRATI